MESCHWSSLGPVLVLMFIFLLLCSLLFVVISLKNEQRQKKTAGNAEQMWNTHCNKFQWKKLSTKSPAHRARPKSGWWWEKYKSVHRFTASAICDFHDFYMSENICRCKRTVAQFFWINIEKPRCSPFCSVLGSAQLTAIYSTHTHARTNPPHRRREKKYFNIFRSQHLHQSKSFSSLISDMTIISKSVFYATRVLRALSPSLCLCSDDVRDAFVCYYFRPSESLLIFIFHISAAIFVRSIIFCCRLCRTKDEQRHFPQSTKREQEKRKKRKQKYGTRVQKVCGALVEWWEGYMPHTESMNHKCLAVVW